MVLGRGRRRHHQSNRKSPAILARRLGTDTTSCARTSTQRELHESDRQADEAIAKTLETLTVQEPVKLYIPTLSAEEEAQVRIFSFHCYVSGLQLTTLPYSITQVETYFRNPKFSSKCGREAVAAGDVYRLKPGKWLNDEIINFYMALLQKRADEDLGPDGEPKRKIHCFNSFFYNKLSEDYTKSKVGRWSKKVSLTNAFGV